MALGGALLQDAQPRAAGGGGRTRAAQWRENEAGARGEGGRHGGGARRRLALGSQSQSTLRQARASGRGEEALRRDRGEPRRARTSRRVSPLGRGACGDTI